MITFEDKQELVKIAKDNGLGDEEISSTPTYLGITCPNTKDGFRAGANIQEYIDLYCIEHEYEDYTDDCTDETDIRFEYEFELDPARDEKLIEHRINVRTYMDTIQEYNTLLSEGVFSVDTLDDLLELMGRLNTSVEGLKRRLSELYADE